MPLRTLTVHVASAVQPQRLTLNNREHLVAPAVLIVEGVLNGALVTAASIEPHDWDGIPITVNHPTNAQGQPISARDPGVLNTAGVGTLYHARRGEAQRGTQTVVSLQAELWLDIAQAAALGGEAQQALAMLESQTLLEVSTGFYPEVVSERGSFYGTPYTEIYQSMRPDHLALLPNAIGACSLEDGCGAPRLHQRECCTACTHGQPCEGGAHVEKEVMTGWQRFLETLRNFVHQEHATPVLQGERLATLLEREIDSRTTETRSRNDIIEAMATAAGISASTVNQILNATISCPPLRRLQGFARALDIPLVRLQRAAEADGCQYTSPETNQTDTDLREALYGALAREMGVDFTPIFIDALDVASQTFTYRQGERLVQRAWTSDESGMVALSPETTDVQRSTTFTPVPMVQAPTEEDSPMSDPIKLRVNALITNAQSGWTETDRPMLEAMSEAQLVRLEAQPRRIVVTQAADPQSVQEAIARMPAHLQEPLMAMSHEYDARKSAAIAILTANKCPIPQEELQAMTAQRLEELVDFAGHTAPAPYAGRGMAHVRPTVAEEQPPAAPSTLDRVLDRQKALGLR